MPAERVQRRLAAIVAVDVVGFSRLMEADEAGTLAALKDHRAATGPISEKYGARLVGTAGDGQIWEFASVVDAVTCSAEVQAAMEARNDGVPEDRRIVFRIGVNLGDVIIDGDDIYGDGVNVAARLEGLAEPGGVCVSGDVYRQVEGKTDLAFDDMGEQKVKNIKRPVRAYRVRLDGGDDGTGSAAASQTPAPDLPGKPSIAVLPFDNLGSDPEQEYFSDGITEDIITELSRNRELLVIARNSSFAYKGKAVDVKRIARELGVRYVLEGSVRRAGERVRITAQLIDARTGSHLWAERYDRDLQDIFDMQDEITRTIVATIVPELDRVEQERAHRKPTGDMTAWDLYQRALWHRWRYNRADHVEALGLFREATEADPEFAAARAERAMLGCSMVLSLWTDDREATLAEALADARRAVELDDRDAATHCALGSVQILLDEGEAAVRALGRAIALNPNFARAHYGLGLAKTLSGGEHDGDGVIEAAGTAMRLSPNDPMLWGFHHIRGLERFLLNDLDEALADFRAACDRANAPHWPYLGVAACLTAMDRPDDAAGAIQQARTKNPDVTISSTLEALGPSASDRLNLYIDALRGAGLPE